MLILKKRSNSSAIALVELNLILTTYKAPYLTEVYQVLIVIYHFHHRVRRYEILRNRMSSPYLIFILFEPLWTLEQFVSARNFHFWVTVWMVITYEFFHSPLVLGPLTSFLSFILIGPLKYLCAKVSQAFRNASDQDANQHGHHFNSF